jgi:hypothetical protein
VFASRQMLLLTACFAVALATDARAADCQRRVGEAPEAGMALSDAVALSPEKGSEQRLKNFDISRGVKEIKRVRLMSDKRLPDTLTSAQLGFDALLERAGAELESVDFTDPTFTTPVITRDRRHIEFTICLSAAGLKAGKYVGSVTVSGPEGLGEGRVGITANLKAKLEIFIPGALVALAIAFGALYWKDSPVTEKDHWWFKTVGVLFVTAGALIGVYLADPAWGAGTIKPIIGLAGSALAAVGGRKLLD